MNRSERLRIAQIAKRKRDVRIDTLRAEFPELDKLFIELSQGTAPNFLLIMAAINEMVGFNSKRRPVSVDLQNEAEKLSQNKCRFCS